MKSQPALIDQETLTGRGISAALDSTADSFSDKVYRDRQLQQVAGCLRPEYQVVRRLSAGSVSDVYEAIEARLQRRVALKVLPPCRAEEAACVERFLGEARTAARLEQHPHIIRIYNIGQKSGFHYFTMNFAEGETLRQRLQRCGRLESSEAVSILRQVLDALDFIHKNGVVHCDIKPENLLFDEDDRLVVTDFGIARRVNEKRPAAGVLMGTPCYMSPEQVSGGEVGPSSDLYAVGVMLYEILAGRLPFAGENMPAVLMKQVYEQPPSIVEQVPGIAPELAALITQLLQKDPACRPASARAVLGVLKEIEIPQPTIVRHVPVQELVRLPSGMPVQKTYREPLPTYDGSLSGMPGKTSLVHAPSVVRLAEPKKRFARLQWVTILLLSAVAGIAVVEIQGLRAASDSPSSGVVAASEKKADIPPKTNPPAESFKAIEQESEQPTTQTATVESTPNFGESTARWDGADARKDSAVGNPAGRSSSVSRDSKGNATTTFARNTDSFENPVNPRSTFQTDSAPKLVEAFSDSQPSLLDSRAGRQFQGSAAPSDYTPRRSKKDGTDTFLVEHDHVTGNCRGKLTIRQDSLTFVSEKEKDSRQWDYSQIRKVNRKGSDRLEFSTSEKDIKKLGFMSRSYKFRFIDDVLSPEVFESLVSRTSGK